MGLRCCFYAAAIAVACGLATTAHAAPTLSLNKTTAEDSAIQVRCGRHCRGFYGRRVYGYRHGNYYEHDLSTLRFGSRRWWSVYDEQHGGRRR